MAEVDETGLLLFYLTLNRVVAAQNFQKFWIDGGFRSHGGGWLWKTVFRSLFRPRA
ncbi:MAG: hypothetical protein ISR51_00285 [Rhodospirillales bacterium]|nr:hypothetical protein [Alphaproteobacteria bacterium]MBL6947087.1 hypothetical protein [Rhodospirillales bacterium]